MFKQLELENKQAYRNYAKLLRKFVPMEQVSSDICKNISALSEFRRAKKLAAFYPLISEVDLTSLFVGTRYQSRLSSKQWFLPRISDDTEMNFYPYISDKALKKNKYGILEPVTNIELSPDEIDIIFLPALLADSYGHRIGYGKGYYDKYLTKLPDNVLKVLPIAEELLVAEFPHGEFDLPVDVIVTQSEVYGF